MPSADHPGLSRRALIRAGVGGVGLLLASGAMAGLVTSCTSPGEDLDASPLRAMGRSLSDGPDGDRLAETLPPGVATPLADDAAVTAALSTVRSSVVEDMAAGRTVLGQGWLLAESEASILVTYARG